LYAISDEFLDAAWQRVTSHPSFRCRSVGEDLAQGRLAVADSCVYRVRGVILVAGRSSHARMFVTRESDTVYLLRDGGACSLVSILCGG
jgi:hypothetical protein